MQGTEKVACHAEGRPDGNVDDHHHGHEERRDKVGYGWIHEDKGREGPSCGVGNEGKAEGSDDGQGMIGEGGELA